MQLVDLLVKAGSSINIINKEGLSPVQLSIQEKSFFVTKLLLMYNCDLDAQSKVRRMYRCCIQQEDMHPHFALEPLFLALTHRSVEMLDLLIKCYWRKPVKLIKSLNQVFKTMPEISNHYPVELQNEIQELFAAAVRTPRGLSESCRAVIREALGPCPQNKMARLPIAKKLHGYILMDEHFADLMDNVKQNEVKHPRDFHDFHSVGYIPDNLDFGSDEEEVEEY